MADNTSIEWTRHPVTGKGATWNPITGCTLVSEGCRHCYAARLAATRLKHHPSRKGVARINAAGEAKFTGEVRFNEQWLDQPLRWKRPRMVFVCAHGDLFHESAPDAWIDRIFAVMALAPQHTFQVLTKRSARMRAYFARPRLEFVISASMLDLPFPVPTPGYWPHLPLPNVWLGVSAEHQATADERIPDLLATPAAIRFVSAEPLLGPINFRSIDISGDEEVLPLGAGWLDRLEPGEQEGPRLDQIIVGGESGEHARPMHPGWARSIRDQCAAADVAFFFKQWGSWAPVCAMDEQAIDDCYHPAPERHPEATRRCKVAHHVVHKNGSRHGILEPMAFLAGTGAMTMFEIGKKRAGRLLDGVEHNGMPIPQEVPAL